MSPDSVPTTTVEREPVAVYNSIAVLVSLVASYFAIEVEPGAVAEAILAVIAVVSPIVATIKARSKVTPVS